MTEYDKWKTEIPGSARLDRITERVNDMSDIQLLKECHARNINLDTFFDELREILIDYLVHND